MRDDSIISGDTFKVNKERTALVSQEVEVSRSWWRHGWITNRQSEQLPQGPESSKFSLSHLVRANLIENVCGKMHHYRIILTDMMRAFTGGSAIMLKLCLEEGPCVKTSF